MKKILSSLMLVTASFMLLFTANNVFAVEYDDLFYTEGISFEVLTTDESAWSATLTPGTFDKLYNLLTENDINESHVKFELEVFVNSVKINAELYFNNYPTNIALELYGEGFNGAVLSGIREDDTVQSYYPPPSPALLVGDIVTILEPKLKSWTNVHDYGRIRLEDTTRNMYLNKVDNEVFLSTTSPDNPNPENHKAFLDQPYENDKNFEVGTKVTLQSPYENFKIIHGSAGENVIVQKDNVSAVYLEKVAQPTSTERIYDITVFYWEDEELLSQVVEDVDLFGLVNLRIMFYGNIRKAIDYQDVMVANVDDLVPLNDFLQYLTAFDPIDGDISDQITVLDDGGYLPEQVGVYNVEFEVTNSQEQQTTIIIPIHVVDIVAPVIAGNSDPVFINYNQGFNVGAWVAGLTVTDNYYTGLTITIHSNSYTSNKSKLGTYEIVVKSTDPSGNTGTLSRTIHVVDEVGPVFSGVETVTVSINENITAEQIKTGLAAVDAIDGNVTSSITIDSDGLTGNANTPGTYNVIFVAEDLSGNQTFYTVQVTVVSEPPGFYVLNKNSVRLLPGANLTLEQILMILGASEATDISTDYNSTTPGVYSLSYTLDDEEHLITLTVLGVDDPIIPAPVIPGENNINPIFYLLGVVALLSVVVIVIKKRS